MNTIKMGTRIYQVEFDDDNAHVGKQITEIIKDTRDRHIESVMRDLPTYVKFKHNVALTTEQFARLRNALSALSLQNITSAIYQYVVSKARTQPFMYMGMELFYHEIDRTICQELNNPQLPLALGPVNEVTSNYRESAFEQGVTSDAELLPTTVDIFQLALPLDTD